MKILDINLCCYNSDVNFFRISLQSILDQTQDRWDLQLVNDGSKPYLKEFIYDEFSPDKYDSIYYTENKKNMGLPYSANVAYKMGSNKYLTYTGDDNYFEPTFLETMVKAAEENNYQAVHSFERLVNLKGNISNNWFPPAPRGNRKLGTIDPRFGGENGLPNHGFIPKYKGCNGASNIWRRSLCEKVEKVYGSFADNNLPGIEDLDIYYKFRELGIEVGFVPEILFNYRLGSSCFSRKVVENSRHKFAAKWKLKKK